MHFHLSFRLDPTSPNEVNQNISLQHETITTFISGFPSLFCPSTSCASPSEEARIAIPACLRGQMGTRQVAVVAQRMVQWEPIIDHTHPPIYTSDTSTCTPPPLYTREVTVLIAGGCRWVPSPSNPPHTASPPLMSRQTTAESKAANGNTEIKTAANVFSNILFPTD